MFTREKTREDGERKRGNRDTIGPRRRGDREREEGKFSVCAITTGISSASSSYLPSFYELNVSI